MNNVLNPTAQYGELMFIIANRFDAIFEIQKSGKGSFAKSENIAFQLRKIIEGVAFCCLVAVKNGLKSIPRDAVGQWSADKIFSQLDRHDIKVLPNPSILRSSTAKEITDVNSKFTIEGRPDKVLKFSDISKIYRSTHGWLHSINPYVSNDNEYLNKNEDILWADVDRVHGMIDKHFISIGGEAFYSVLRDDLDHTTKVMPFSKLAD